MIIKDEIDNKLNSLGCDSKLKQEMYKILNHEIAIFKQLVGKLHTRQGFLDYFWETYKTYRTYFDAYEDIEETYIEIFGQRKYKDFDSFRQTLYRNKN